MNSVSNFSEQIESAYSASLSRLPQPAVEAYNRPQIQAVTSDSPGLVKGKMVAATTQQKTEIASWWKAGAPQTSSATGPANAVASKLYRTIFPQSAANKDKATAADRFTKEFNPINVASNIANAKAVIATRIKAQSAAPTSISKAIASNKSEAAPKEISDDQALALIDQMVSTMETSENLSGLRGEGAQAAEVEKASDTAASKSTGIVGFIMGSYHQWSARSAAAERVKAQEGLTEKAMTSVLRTIDLSAIRELAQQVEPLQQTCQNTNDGIAAITNTNTKTLEGGLSQISSRTFSRPLGTYHDLLKGCITSANQAKREVDEYASLIQQEKGEVEATTPLPGNAVGNVCVYSACLAAHSAIVEKGGLAIKALQALAKNPEDVGLKKAADQALQDVDQATAKANQISERATSCLEASAKKSGQGMSAADTEATTNLFLSFLQLCFLLATS